MSSVSGRWSRQWQPASRVAPTGEVQDEGVTDNAEGYLLDNRQAEAGERFVAMSELFDPVTFRHLEQIGISPGWACWEVGAGAPGVPRWLATQVGASGRVLATDLDTSWLPAGEIGYEVLRHEVGVDPVPAGEFDLIHARLLLVHLPRRAEVLQSLVQVLRPGGWLVIEDADTALQPLVCPDESGPQQELANRVQTAIRSLLADRGADLAFGRTLPRLLREADLDDVRADGFFPLSTPVRQVLQAATVRQVREGLLAAGLVSEADIEQHLADLATGTLDLATAPLISAWGRKPG